MFIELNLAYRTLIDKDLRKKYDIQRGFAKREERSPRYSHFPQSTNFDNFSTDIPYEIKIVRQRKKPVQNPRTFVGDIYGVLNSMVNEARAREKAGLGRTSEGGGSYINFKSILPGASESRTEDLKSPRYFEIFQQPSAVLENRFDVDVINGDVLFGIVKQQEGDENKMQYFSRGHLVSNAYFRRETFSTSIGETSIDVISIFSANELIYTIEEVEVASSSFLLSNKMYNAISKGDVKTKIIKESTPLGTTFIFYDNATAEEVCKATAYFAWAKTQMNYDFSVHDITKVDPNVLLFSVVFLGRSK